MNENNITEISENNAVAIQQILTRIDTIVENKGHITEAIEACGNPAVDSNVFLEIVREREQTNIKILEMLEKQFDKLTNNSEIENIKALAEILYDIDRKSPPYSQETKEFLRNAATEAFGMKWVK